MKPNDIYAVENFANELKLIRHLVSSNAQTFYQQIPESDSAAFSSFGTYRNWESGRNRPDPTELIIIMRYFARRIPDKFRVENADKLWSLCGYGKLTEGQRSEIFEADQTAPSSLSKLAQDNPAPCPPAPAEECPPYRVNMPEPEGCRNGWPGSETAHFKKFYKSCGRLEKEAFEEPPALELGRYPGWITGLAWSPNSKSIAGITAPGMGYNLASLFRFKNITGFASHLIIWSFSTQQEIRREMAHSGWGDTVDWSKEGHWIATGGLDKVVRVWNTQTWQSAKLELHQARVLQVRFHPAESIIASVDNAGGVLLWDYIHGKVVGQYIIESGKQATSIAWLEQGQKLAVGSADGSINLLDRSNQTLTRELRLAGQEEWIWSITLSPCNGLIASRGQANTIKIWQLNYPGPIKELKGLKKTINCLEWSPAGHLLAAAGDDGIITIWDTATWQVKHTLKFNQHSPLWHKLPYVKDLNYHRSIRTVRWSPDGRSLAASDNAGRVLVWKIT